MIKLFRVDFRLLHGQIAFGWANMVGADCILLASDSLPAKQVQQLTELLFSSRETLEEQLGLALDPETDAVEGVGIPFHAGAAAWYKQAGITVD